MVETRAVVGASQPTAEKNEVKEVTRFVREVEVDSENELRRRINIVRGISSEVGGEKKEARAVVGACQPTAERNEVKEVTRFVREVGESLEALAFAHNL